MRNHVDFTRMKENFALNDKIVSNVREILEINYQFKRLRNDIQMLFSVTLNNVNSKLRFKKKPNTKHNRL